MNFAEIENAWRSPHNRPDAAEMEKQKMQFVAELRRRRRAALGLLGITFIPLAYLTAKVVLHMVRPDPSLDAVDLTREWGIVPFFLLPWIGWLALAWWQRRHWIRHRDYARSVSASVAALLDENRAQRRRAKLVGGLLAASVLVLPLVVHQLRAVGKAGDEILLPAFAIYPAYVLGMIGWLVYHDRRKLAPAQRELEALLSSYR